MLVKLSVFRNKIGLLSENRLDAVLIISCLAFKLLIKLSISLIKIILLDAFSEIFAFIVVEIGLLKPKRVIFFLT